MDALRSLKELQNEAGSAKYIALFGKTFVEENSVEYQNLKSFSAKLIEMGYGVVHGGYVGLMRAAADGAEEIIDANNLSRNLNIGVPEITLDANGVPRSGSVHTVAANGILERVHILIEACDYAIVAEKGGFGTLLEAVAVFHINQLNKKFGGKMRPIIFVGNVWKELFDNILGLLDMHNQDSGNSFCHFVASYEDALVVIKNSNISDV